MFPANYDRYIEVFGGGGWVPVSYTHLDVYKRQGYRRVSGNSGRSVRDNDRAVSGSFVVSGAYVERQKLWTAYGVFASLCRASDGTENLFQLR